MRAAWFALCICTLIPRGGARATVSADRGEPDAPTVVVMQKGDPLVSGAGARASAGDFRLEYGTVVYVVSQPGPPGPAGAASPGGTLIDVVETFPAQRRLGLEHLTTYLDDSVARQAVYEKAEVRRSRELATVEVSGHDREDPSLQVVTQYQVGPQLGRGEALRIITTVHNTGKAQRGSYRIGDAVRWGALERFLPGPGFQAGTRGRLPYLLGIGSTTTLSYLPGDTLYKESVSGQHGLGWSHISAPPAPLPRGGSLRYVRYLQVAADPFKVLCQEPAAARGSRALFGLVREERAEGRKEGKEVPLAGVIVVLETAAGEAVFAGRSDAEGRFALCAPAPGSYRVRAEAPGRAMAVPFVAIQIGAEVPKEIVLTLSRRARLSLSLREGDKGRAGRLIAGRVGVHPTSGTPGATAISAETGTVVRLGGETVALSETGELDLHLPPGSYRLSAARGLFHEIASQEVTLKAGETRKLTLVLRRAVPASEVEGARCAMLRTLPPTPLSRVAARAEALDLVLTTYPEMLAGGRRGPPKGGPGLVLGDLTVIPAAEIITSTRGRFNVYPLTRGSAELDQRLYPSMSALVGALRRIGQEGEPPLVQADFSTATTLDATARIDAREIWTGRAVGRVQDRMRSWLERLQAGIRETAVAGLDPQSDLASAGLPRTCFGAVESVRARGAGEFLRAAIRDGDLLLTNGPWLRVSANGAGMGELGAAPDGKVTVGITVLAAPHIDVHSVEVWSGPRLAQRVPVPPSIAPLRLQREVSLLIDRDTPIVVLARGERPLDQLSPQVTPLAITNAVLIDRNGDGRFGSSAPEPVKR